jgi:hypothetical protein
MRKRLAWAALVLAAALASAPASWTKGQHDFELRVLSSPATMVTGGDALVQLEIPRNVPLHKAKLFRNGVDVTSTLEVRTRSTPRQKRGQQRAMPSTYGAEVIVNTEDEWKPRSSSTI